MRRMYQQEWHRIPFSSFATLSSTRLADASFYAAFYQTFFEKYRAPEDLEPQWLTVKRQAAAFLQSRPELPRESRILSIGCGLGFIEQQLLAAGYQGIEINEVSRQPLRWIEPQLEADRIHVGFFPECVPLGRSYDVILLGGVDGVFDREGLRSLLRSVHDRLVPGGHCILLSWSHHVGRSPLRALIDGTRDAMKAALDRLGIRPRGQFWGFLRSRKEIRGAVQEARLEIVGDGVLERTTIYPPYWLVARKL